MKRLGFLIAIIALVMTGCKTRSQDSWAASSTSGVVTDVSDFRPNTEWQGYFRMVWRQGPSGAVVTQLEKLGYAHVIGVNVGDTIVRMNGRKITKERSIDQVATQIASTTPEQWFFEIKRSGLKDEDGDPVDSVVLTKPDGYSCNPMPPVLIGCGPAR